MVINFTPAKLNSKEHLEDASFNYFWPPSITNLYSYSNAVMKKEASQKVLRKVEPYSENKNRLLLTF